MSLPPSPDPRPDWARVRELFDAALPLAPAAREALLADPALPPALVAELRSLLAHAAEVSAAEADGAAFLGPAGAPAWAAPAASAGLQLGAWRLLAPLGVGGMGEVWRAARSDGRFEGEAAVKLLKRGMDSTAVLARFAQEQQALARLSHPHIARLFDAGLGADGRPYFVMELVEGRPLDQACQGLALEARLKLFLQLADAVAHAHRNLLVHRDLKPSNVLVDGAGQVKLLDFGIAKALDPLEASTEATAEAALTQAGQRPFTPHYASPEQVRGEPVSTATDLYSLGVLLYVMLTGQRPYGRAASNAAEAARAVLEEAPTRPSSVAQPSPGWEATRRRLRGDLDNILMKALRKLPEERYLSVEALAADVRAYLEGRPVSAQPPRFGYLARKFVARHRGAVAAASLAVLALAVGLAVALVQAEQARLARASAEQRLAALQQLTREVVFRYGDAVTYLPGGLQVKERMMTDAVQRLQAFAELAAGDPGLQGDVAGAWARLAYVQADENSASLGKPEDALANADRALAAGTPVLAQREGDAEFVLWLARAHIARGHALRQADRKPEALAAFEAAAALLQRGVARQPTPAASRTLRVERAALRHAVGQLRYQPGTFHLNQPDEALAEFALARRELQALEAEQHDVEVLYQLGSVVGGEHKVHLGREAWAEAVRTGLEALALRQRTAQEDPASVVYQDGLQTEANNIGFVLLREGRVAEALAATTASREAGLLLARQHGPASKWARWTRLYATTHGRALAASGRLAEAVAMFEEAEGEWTRMQAEAPAPANEFRRSWTAVQRGKALAALGRRAEAAAVLQAAWQAFEGWRSDEGLRFSALLNGGEAALALHALQPQAGWKRKAREAYEAAQALRPLKGEYALALARSRA